MVTEEEKDYIEKVIRLKPKCANELKIPPDEITLEQFIKWLISKIPEEIKESESIENPEVK